MNDTFQKTEFYKNLLENAETCFPTIEDAASVEIFPIYTIFMTQKALAKLHLS